MALVGVVYGQPMGMMGLATLFLSSGVCPHIALRLKNRLLRGVLCTAAPLVLF